MKNLMIFLFCFLLLGMTQTFASLDPDSTDSKYSQKSMEEPVETLIIKGRAKWIDENTLKCKGKKGTCAMIKNDVIHVFKMVVFVGGDDVPSDEFWISAYTTEEGIEDNETYTDIFLEGKEDIKDDEGGSDK